MVKGYNLPAVQLNGLSDVTYQLAGPGQLVTGPVAAQQGSLMATTQRYERELLEGRAPDPYDSVPALHGYGDVRGYIELAGLGEFDDAYGDAAGSTQPAYEMRDVTSTIQTGNVLSLGPPPSAEAAHPAMTGNAVTDAAGRVLVAAATGPSLFTLAMWAGAAYLAFAMFKKSRRRVRR